MPNTKCINDKDYVLLNLVTKKCSCSYMLRQGPCITVYIYRALYNNAGLGGLTAKCFEGNKNCNKISAVRKNKQLWFQL